jgi:hypothetical protein
VLVLVLVLVLVTRAPSSTEHETQENEASRKPIIATTKAPLRPTLGYLIMPLLGRRADIQGPLSNIGP